MRILRAIGNWFQELGENTAVEIMSEPPKINDHPPARTLEFCVDDVVLVYDRYRFGSNGLKGVVLKIQKREEKEPEALVRLGFPITIPWPKLYDDRGYKEGWYCFNQLRDTNDQA